MDYHRIYREFIADRKAKPKPDGYVERHHILPRSMGGSDDPGNLVDLTARDHYFAHCCLAKAHGGKMWSALFAIAHMAKHDETWRYFCRRRMVAAARAKAAIRRSQHMTELWASGRFVRTRIYRSWTDEERQRRSDTLRGRTMSPIAVERSRQGRLKSSPRFDFEHEDGRRFSGCAIEFIRFSGVSQGLVSCLTRKKINWAKGWMLAGGDQRAVKGRDPLPRVFVHTDGRSFEGTRREFQVAFPHLDSGSLSKMIGGKLGSVNGWRLTETTVPNG